MPKKPKRAAPPATAPIESLPRSFDSLQSAAAFLKVDKGRLQVAKEDGADGFKGSRLYPLELLSWFLKRPTVSGTGKPVRDKRTIEIEIKEEELEGIRWEKARARGEYVEKVAVDRWMLDTAEKIKEILRSRLKNQLPPNLVGLSAAEIAAKMDSVIKELVNLFRGDATSVTKDPAVKED